VGLATRSNQEERCRAHAVGDSPLRGLSPLHSLASQDLNGMGVVGGREYDHTLAAGLRDCCVEIDDLKILPC